VRGDSAHCWSVLQQKQSPGAFYVSSAATFQVGRRPGGRAGMRGRPSARRPRPRGGSARPGARAHPPAPACASAALPPPLLPPSFPYPAAPVARHPLPLRPPQQDTAQQLPRDFRKLHERAGLSSFLSVLISAGQRVLGSLTIAARAPHAFSEPWWQPVLTMCASALLPHLRNRQVRAPRRRAAGQARGPEQSRAVGRCCSFCSAAAGAPSSWTPAPTPSPLTPTPTPAPPPPSSSTSAACWSLSTPSRTPPKPRGDRAAGGAARARPLHTQQCLRPGGGSEGRPRAHVHDRSPPRGSLVIYGVSHFMRATTNVAMAVRLGLIHRDRLLVIEQDPHDGG
jgi:hypothetical protein